MEDKELRSAKAVETGNRQWGRIERDAQPTHGMSTLLGFSIAQSVSADAEAAAVARNISVVRARFVSPPGRSSAICGADGRHARGSTDLMIFEIRTETHR